MVEPSKKLSGLQTQGNILQGAQTYPWSRRPLREPFGKYRVPGPEDTSLRPTEEHRRPGVTC